jgi:hypothetical protein
MITISNRLSITLCKFFVFPASLYRFLIVGAGFAIYFLGVCSGFLRIFLDTQDRWLGVISAIVWYSGIPVIIGLVLILIDLVFLLPFKRIRKGACWNPVDNLSLTVVLTAFNDELSIGSAAEDFRSHPLVRRVVVVGNNSVDRTSEVAQKAGTIVVLEARQGYGNCV